MTDLAKIIESESEWPALVEALKDEGISFRDGRKSIVKKVRKLWYKSTEGKTFEEDLIEGLPGSVVNINDRTYFIHGVLHSGPFNFKASKEYRQLIQESIDGWNVLCESGFMNEFSLSSFSSTGEGRVREMGDSNYFLAAFFPNPEKAGREFLKLLGKGLLMAPFMVPLKMIRARVGYFGKLNDKAKGIRNLEDLRDIRQFGRRMFLPEPLIINSLKFLYGDDYKSSGTRSQNQSNSLVLRSAMQAEEMTRYVNENDLKELHTLVGFLHESQTKYFLEHPERIDEMKRGNDIYTNGEKWRNSKN